MYSFETIEALKAWKIKRKKTFYTCLVVSLMSGLSFSFITNLFTKNHSYNYGDGEGVWNKTLLPCFYLSALLSVVAAGRWLDKTRRVKMYSYASLIAQLCGLAFYCIPYHPMTLLLSAIASGIGTSFPKVVMGEFLRIYAESESKAPILWISTAYAFGLIVGPFYGTFPDLNPNGSLQISPQIIIAICIGVGLLLSLIATKYFLSDCSGEFDLKRYTWLHRLRVSYDSQNGNEVSIGGEQPFNENTQLLVEDEIAYDTTTIRVVLKTLVLDLDVILIHVATLVLAFSISTSLQCLILLVIPKFYWGIKGFEILFAVYGVGCVLPTVAIILYVNSKKTLIYSTIILMCLQMIAYAIVAILGYDFRRGFVNDSLVIIFACKLVVGNVLEMFFLRFMLALRVPSHLQCFTEGLRTGMVYLGTVCAVFSTSTLPALRWMSVGLSVSILMLVFAFILRRRYFVNTF